MKPNHRDKMEATGTAVRAGHGRRMRLWAVALAIGVAMTPAMAQQTAQPGVTQRVDRLEREMRAVQRKVFPGSNGQQYFEPEIAPTEAPAVGVPATSPLNDLTSRVSALEAELSRLTGQIEQNSFKIRQLEEAATRQKSDLDARLRALEGGEPAGSASAAPPTITPPPPTPRPSSAASSPAAPPANDPAPAASSGDPAEDAYLAGYRLWEAHQYDRAATALRAVVERYPNHRRASYAQNLLGRSLLDNGQPARAAEIFYANYQRMPRGERAPDSLYYLGQSLMAIRPAKPQDACKVYAELLDVYGTTINAALRGKVTEGQRSARCAN